MDIKKAKGFISSTKVDLSDFFGGEEAYIVLREPTTPEFYRLQEGAEKDGDAVYLENFLQLMPALIVEHGFTANSKPATNEAVAGILQERMEITMKVVEAFQGTVPLLQAKPKK